jgi:hypothetical protein
MIFIRTLIDNTWHYLFLDGQHEPWVYARLDGAWDFQDMASANRVLKHLANIDRLKKYQFEVHEMIPA